MLNDEKLKIAVTKILQRSERQVDQNKIIETFVDLGILSQLDNRNNQIIYGRRGTGKTHVFRALISRLKSADKKNVVVYIDARVLGSSAQFTDSTTPLKRRCLALFRDLISPLYNSLLEHIVENPSQHALEAIKILDQLLIPITEAEKSLREEKRSASEANTSSSKVSAEASIITPALSATAEASKIDDKRKSVEQTFTVSTDDKILFPDISYAINKTLELGDAQLYFLIDEWSSLPLEIQPYLAEFLKRTLLPLQRVTMKIAALEYRSKFLLGSNSSYIGFELGADISTAPDLDEYYVFDRNPDRITEAYGDILLRHINAELEPEYLSTVYGIKNGKDLGSKLFTQLPTLKELARASECVIRDLINIFSKAYFHAHKRGRETIDNKAVLEAAREWFEQDKTKDLDDEMHEVLRQIVDEVIGTKKARSFLMKRDLERHPLIQKLIDARVLHHMQRGYADKDNPGIRYNIYSLDYGTYVDLIGTSKQPAIDLEENESSDTIVPFDDKRSIRRIILDKSILDRR